ncbi:MAG: LytTR family DNA-binding domain-containing protein [Hespellia sp.]|nr:LytTR family DNA-binding domain-containing protein [Hespellia sp.]
MNANTLTQLSIDIITEYYKNNLQPFFDKVDDDIIWIGPAEGQWIRGREPLISTWSNEEHNLTFSMSNIVANTITSASSYCEVILNYVVFTHYPDNNTLCHKQCLHYTWCERKIPADNGSIEKVPRILVLHISNSYPYDKRDTIYPIHYTSLASNILHMQLDKNRIFVKCIDQSTYYLLVNTIQWMESDNNGFHTKIHTDENVIVANCALSSIAKKYPNYFVRIHASYLINPHFAYKISRFKIELRNGTILPIPQKKYTSIKKQLEHFLI